MGNSASKSEDIAVSRQNRQKCWDKRDAYFACLDQAGVLKAGEEGKTCASQKAEYENNCAKSWVNYFNQRRILAERQKSLLAQTNSQAQEAKRRSL